METGTRALAALAALSAVASLTGCSLAADSTEPSQWRQVDAAQNLVHDVLSDDMVDIPTPAVLRDRLSEAVVQWEPEDDPIEFAEVHGTAVFYNFQDSDGDEEAAFDVFVASGVRSESSTPEWLDARPRRVYTCYRYEVTFESGYLDRFHRVRDYGEDALACPPELVDALGSGAHYREPWLFDG